MQLPQSPPAAAYSKSQTVTELSNCNTVTFQNFNSIFFSLSPRTTLSINTWSNKCY